MNEVAVVRPDSEQMRRCSIFRQMPARSLKRIETCARVAQFRAHSMIIKEGDDACEVGWLLEGTADLLVNIAFGEQINLMTLTKGMPFGCSAAVSSQKYQASVRAREDCQVALLDLREALRDGN